MNVFDLICILLLLLFAVVGYIKGLARIILRFAALLAAYIGARAAAQPVASYIYGAYVHTAVLNKINELLPAGSVGGSLETLLTAVEGALPEPAQKIAAFMHLLPSESWKGSAFYTTAELEEVFVQPIITKVLTFVVSAAVFMILSMLLIIVVYLINKHLFSEKHKVLSTVNRLFGALFGVLQGAIPVAVVCLIMNLVAPLIENEGFTTLIDGSVLCGWIANIF